MGYFRPATLSFTAPRDFFDNVGKNAPVTRFNIELPKELTDYPQTDGSAPYTLQSVDPQVLSEIQAAVLREYGGVAKQCLGAFRQGNALSELAINNRMAALDNGVGMSYSVQFGRETISINVSADVVRKLVGETALYMLVLYGTNKIAYVPMASIASPTGKVKKKALTKSNFGEPYWYSLRSQTRVYRIFMCQIKISKSFHALTGIMEISKDGVITIPKVSDQTPVFNIRDTLLKSAKSTTPRSDARPSEPVTVGTYFGWGGSTNYVNTIINGDKNTVWNDRGNKFEWDQKKGVMKVSDGEIMVTHKESESYTRFFALSPIMGITSDGGRFTDMTCGHRVWSYGTGGGAFTEELYALWAQSVSQYTSNIWGEVTSYGPGKSEIHTVNWPAGYPPGSGSGPARVQVYEKTKEGLDKLTMGESTVTYTGGFEQSGPFEYNTLVSDISGYFGYSGTASGTPDRGNYPGLRAAIQFPPSLGTGQDKVYFLYGDYDSPGIMTGYIQTPYGVQHKMSFRNEEDLWIDPWLHASNGKHVLQGYDWPDGGALWLDGVDYGNKLATAIGCDFDDLKAVILDVKKSDIDKLK